MKRRRTKLFDGAVLTVRYFFDPLDMELWRTLLYRGLESEQDVLEFPQYLDEAYAAGRDLCSVIIETNAATP